jgi:hypothetical protein
MLTIINVKTSNPNTIGLFPLQSIVTGTCGSVDGWDAMLQVAGSSTVEPTEFFQFT